ncbi:NAD(P)-dependent oxidoreductase [Geobacter sp. DSM 9736]|uniref:NAD-dependent epimerase/dehydratase family protein n=1 Tax=Geobacter sp. DSM 9736 TaxID=1277350 RepID=UPI000B50337C|nr:NAD(P)-dependent oxidoreductase [Geobacter sp. DSM 9736]SNB45029.1 Nucleoside-diphosphate-sugar epimerase [Geobacter sp. DSM 9736]
MKIVVTGATGFLGSRLVRALLKSGHTPVVLKRSFSDLGRIRDLLPALMAYDIDLCGLQFPFREVGSIEAVIHCATCYGRKGESASEVLESNLLFPLRLMEAAIESGVPHFINTDTCLDRSISAYALGKKQFSEWGQHFSELQRIRFVNIMLEHFYGPGDDPSKFTSHVIRSCIRNISELKLTKGDQKRDFVYIDDVVAAYLVLLGALPVSNETYQEYPLGSGVSVSVRDFVQTVYAITGSTTELKFGAVPYRQNELMDSCADIRRLAALGWLPRVSLVEGVAATVSYEMAHV